MGRPKICEVGDVWSTDNDMWPLVIVEEVGPHTATVKNIVEPPGYGSGLFRRAGAAKKHGPYALVRRFCTVNGLARHVERFHSLAARIERAGRLTPPPSPPTATERR